jgi:hypothetical protein
MELYAGNVPTLFFYHEGDFFRWDEKHIGVDQVDSFLNWINKLLFPLA